MNECGYANEEQPEADTLAIMHQLVEAQICDFSTALLPPPSPPAAGANAPPESDGAARQIEDGSESLFVGVGIVLAVVLGVAIVALVVFVACCGGGPKIARTYEHRVRFVKSHRWRLGLPRKHTRVLTGTIF